MAYPEKAATISHEGETGTIVTASSQTVTVTTVEVNETEGGIA
jgi:hypothetical protein